MSDQSLREAVQSLREDLARSYPIRAQYDVASTTIDRLDSMLAAHRCLCLQDETGIEVKPGCPEHDPRPAQVEITAALAERVTAAYYAADPTLDWADAGKYARAGAIARTRQILEAAAPLLGPPSLLDSEQVAVTIRAHTLFPADEVETRETCACGWRPTGNPMLAYSDHARHVRDAVMELARPMPTHEQIEPEVRKVLKDMRVTMLMWGGGTPKKPTFDGFIANVAAAVLALLNGAES